MTFEWKCRYWSKKFGVRSKELKRAVRQVGDKAEAVERFLQNETARAKAEHVG